MKNLNRCAFIALALFVGSALAGDARDGVRIHAEQGKAPDEDVMVAK